MTKDNIAKFKTFDLSKIESNSFCIILGKKGSGKTSMIQNILYNIRGRIRAPILISKTASTTGVFNNMIPQVLQFDEPNVDLLENIVMYCMNMADIINTPNNKFKGYKHETCLIADDILGDNGKWMKDGTFKDIIFNGRNYDMTILMAIQDGLGLTANFRDNVDYLFITGAEARNKKIIYEHYWDDSWGDKKECYNLINKFLTQTDRGSTMVIDRKHKGKTITDSIYYLHVKSPKRFCDKRYHKYVKVGAKKMWYGNRKLINARWKQDKLKAKMLKKTGQQYMFGGSN